MAAYYNENDPFAAQWLRELIKAGLIADGEVDERDIRDVQAEDVRGFTQCHWFAGIGGWSLAFMLAGWPDDRSAWTGSCPCQPFSSAGKGHGAADPRHLWPTWFQLIRECRPSVVFGEQVASADGLGWLDLVSHNMEGEDYAIGAADLCAPCVGAFDIRQRLYWVADSTSRNAIDGAIQRGRQHGLRTQDRYADGDSIAPEREKVVGLGYTHGAGLPERDSIPGSNQRQVGARARKAAERTGSPFGFWFPRDWIDCTDGKSRPIEPGTFPLAHGVPARVGRLRGYGNAIKPQVAQAFIESYLEAIER